MNDHHIDLTTLFPDTGNGESWHISCTEYSCKYITIDSSNGDVYITSVTKDESFSRIKLTPLEFKVISSTILAVSNSKKELKKAV